MDLVELIKIELKEKEFQLPNDVLESGTQEANIILGKYAKNIIEAEQLCDASISNDDFYVMSRFLSKGAYLDYFSENPNIPEDPIRVLYGRSLAPLLGPDKYLFPKVVEPDLKELDILGNIARLPNTPTDILVDFINRRHIRPDLAFKVVGDSNIPIEKLYDFFDDVKRHGSDNEYDILCNVIEKRGYNPDKRPSNSKQLALFA